MSHYIALINYTDKGMANIKDSPGRLDKARTLLRDMGGEFKQVYLTMGGHDMVVIYESPDDATLIGRIEGLRDGQTRRIDYPMKRVACPGGVR